MRKKLLNTNKAFTLIEVIVSLILIGIMAAIAGMGLVNITQGYVFAKLNAGTFFKAQVAMTRIAKEIESIPADSTTAVSAVTGSSINYTNGVLSVNRTVALSGTQLQIDGTTLVDNVTAFTLSYFDAAGAVTTIPAAIRKVDVTLSLQGADNTVSTFNNSFKIKESCW